MKDKAKQDQKDLEETLDYRRSQTGNHFAILFLLVPIGGIIWALRSKVVLPVDQLDFLIKSFLYTTLSFSLLWVLSYINVKRDRKLFAASAFFYLLWMIACPLLIGKINIVSDDSTEKTYYMKALGVIKTAGGHKSRPSCTVKIEKKTLNVDTILVKYDECDSIRPNIDGLLVKVKDGALGMPWMTDHSIVKDYDLYKSRLGITD